MSSNFGNGYRRNLSGYQLKSNEITRNPVVPGTPVVYSQSHIMRNQQSESEPLSEYTEMSLTSSVPAPFRQMTPEASPRPMMLQGSLHSMTPHRVFEMQPLTPVRASPYSRPTHSKLLPPPIPQCFIAQNSPNQSLFMQPVSPVPASNVKKIVNSTSAVVKVNSNSARNTSQGTKMSSVTRQRYFIGSIDQVVRWHKMAKDAQLYAIYQVPAILESVMYGQNGIYTFILRSDQKNNAPPLQAIFYAIDRELPKMECGKLVMSVGRMVGANKLQVFNMWPIEPDSLVGIKRISFLCQRALQEALLATPEP